MGVVGFIVLGLVAALMAPALTRILRGATGWFLAVLPLGMAAYLVGLIPAVAGGESLRTSFNWIPSLGIRLSFYIDGLSLLFALLISFVGAVVLIYGGGYMAGHPRLGRFYAYLLLFMVSMMGLVLADDLILMFVFWELTSFSSYLLIGFDCGRDAARAAALQALLVTAGGGLVLLLGLLLLGHVGGSYEVSVLFGRATDIRSHPFYLLILGLVLVGAFTKSAQFPFHFWLPSAMEAPTPVSAYLHSATMVKAGVFLLARLSPILGQTDAWHYLVAPVGLVTMLVGAILAFGKNDLKQILAFTTISSLGMLVLLIGLDTSLSMAAAMVFLLVHAFYKGALFLVAGAVDHETGSRDLRELGGLRRAMPITTAAALLAALSMIGLPPMLGFLGKELIYEAKMLAPRLAWLVTGVGVLSNMWIAATGLLCLAPFWGARKSTPKFPHEAPPSLWLGPLIFGGLGLLLGLLPEQLGVPLVGPAVKAVRAEPTAVKLVLWHGLNPLLLLSAVTIAGGLGIFALRGPIRRLLAQFDRLAVWGPAKLYDQTVDATLALARWQTRILQSGYLRYYVLLVVGTAVALCAYALLDSGGFGSAPPLSRVETHEWSLVVLILAGAVTAVRSQSRLAAIASLSVVGYGVALVYILYGAPDLAMTQVLVETLTVILFVFVFYHLPRFARFSPQGARVRDAIVATAAGALMTTLVLAATSVPAASRIAPFFAEHSVPQARGRNIVNVILVDFRALDTLGEITVLAVAAVGVYALLKLRPGRER
jgi:multicomponent Na+:H+ antiporter subunit A